MIWSEEARAWKKGDVLIRYRPGGYVKAEVTRATDDNVWLDGQRIHRNTARTRGWRRYAIWDEQREKDEKKEEVAKNRAILSYHQRAVTLMTLATQKISQLSVRQCEEVISVLSDLGLEEKEEQT